MGTSVVELPALGVSQPVWEYGARAMATDLGFHLVHGKAVALAYELVA